MLRGKIEERRENSVRLGQQYQLTSSGSDLASDGLGKSTKEFSEEEGIKTPFPSYLHWKFQKRVKAKGERGGAGAFLVLEDRKKER